MRCDHSKGPGGVAHQWLHIPTLSLWDEEEEKEEGGRGLTGGGGGRAGGQREPRI